MYYLDCTIENISIDRVIQFFISNEVYNSNYYKECINNFIKDTKILNIYLFWNICQEIKIKIGLVFRSFQGSKKSAITATE